MLTSYQHPQNFRVRHLAYCQFWPLMGSPWLHKCHWQLVTTTLSYLHLQISPHIARTLLHKGPLIPLNTSVDRTDGILCMGHTLPSPQYCNSEIDTKYSLWSSWLSMQSDLRIMKVYVAVWSGDISAMLFNSVTHIDGWAYIKPWLWALQLWAHLAWHLLLTLQKILVRYVWLI